MPSKRNLELYAEIKDLNSKYGSNLIFVDFTGMNVESITNFRREIKKRSGYYKVVKNTVAYKFFKNDMGIDIPLVGVNGIVFADDVAFFDILKYIVKLEKDNPVKVKSSLFEKMFYSREQTIELSKLPSKNELIGYVVGAVSGGVSSFVYTLNNIVQSFVFVLKAIEDKKK
ncbi:MAG: 50S ribosomal protein L10 [Brevinematales bacterium]|nr:50S ribosomal protein L10 [Brevinematales bacterium]